MYATSDPRTYSAAGRTGEVREAGPKADANPPPARPRPQLRTLLLVDSDKVFCRYIELSIERGGQYSVEAVNDSQAALDVLSNTTVDAILCSLVLPDSDGLQFVERIRRQRRWRDLPCMLAAEEFGRVPRIAAIKLGIDALVTKPVDLAELEARLEMLFCRKKRLYDEFMGQRFSLAGDFNGIAFCDLISLLEMGKRNGRLSIATPRAAAELVFQMGKITHVSFANLFGANAFYELMRESSGSFEFCAGPAEGHGDPLRISSLALLLEGARRIDAQFDMAHAKAESNGGASVVAATAEGAAGGDESCRALEANSAPRDPEWIAQLEQTFSDEFGLGEMRLFVPAQLSEWTRAEKFEKRFHIFLVCDPVEGVEAMSAIASPLGTSEICAAFSNRVKAAALFFALPGNRMADIVLIDQNEPHDSIANLGIKPAVMLLAPARGDWLSLSVKARVGMVQLLKQVAPEVIYYTGNAVLEEGLAEIQRLTRRAISAKGQLGAMGQKGATLRELLLSSLDFWKRQRE